MSKLERRLLKDLVEAYHCHAGQWSAPGLHAVWAYRIGRWRRGLSSRLIRGLLKLPCQAMFIWCRNFYGIEIPDYTQIGRRFVVEHQGGIIINGHSRIGDDCIVRQGVTLGGKGSKGRDEAPTLGNAVEIGAGAKIIGSITIGDHCVIGANAVVVKDVPSHCIAVGVPARIISRLDVANPELS